jgi:polar amino acid transport system substrate-binding protein
VVDPDEVSLFTDGQLGTDALSEGMFHRTLDFCRSIARAVDAKAEYFPGHSDGVAYLTQLIGNEIGIDHVMLRRLQAASLLHDTGKLRVPDRILLAPRKLTVQEFEIMKQHSIWSAELAAGLSGFELDVAVWIRHHHEAYDGSGYPDGLAGEDIPWQSRLMLVADAFHVMTAYRPYQVSRSRTEAILELIENAGTQFDPKFVDVIMDRPDIRQIYTERYRDARK